MTKDDLLSKIYGLEISVSNTIPAHVHNLRRKFKRERSMSQTCL
ncbi:hypothetical protein [Pseudovibrio sp. Alg231-02]